MAGKKPGLPIYRGSGPASYSFLPPSYDTHRQFDYGVCVQHFGEHVSDDRRKRGRKERKEGGSLGIVTRNRERGTIRACALPCEGKCPYLPWWPRNGSFAIFFFPHHCSSTTVGPRIVILKLIYFGFWRFRDYLL